ncbi:MAG: hypothetical protein ACP5JT_06235, partial [Thermoplasmata archaeon]
MKTVAIISYPNYIIIRKLSKKEINQKQFKYQNNTYLIEDSFIYRFEKKRFIFSKITNYIFYENTQPEPLKLNLQLEDDEKLKYKILVEQKLYKDTFNPPEKDLLLGIILLITGILAGILIGLVIAPHILITHITPPT